MPDGAGINGDVANEPLQERLSSTMTSRRLQVLAFVRGYIMSRGGSPSVSEIAAGVGCGATRVKQHLRSLIDQGALLRKPGPPGTGRNLLLPDQRDEALRVLRALGWIVNPSACPQTTLLSRPVLSYPHGDDSEVAHGAGEE